VVLNLDEDRNVIRILTMSGSLREASSNTSLLIAAERLAPAGVSITRYRGMGELPHFNPDFETALPAQAVALRADVGQADGLLICCPEYARGIPGSFKNVLDWLVGDPDFHAKPVALFNASPRASAAQAALRLVLTTMSARIIEEASLTVDLLTRKMGPEAIASDPALSQQIAAALAALRDAAGR
jgi:chromate reductase, NAD(P)H dehydrogenase (quinone)